LTNLLTDIKSTLKEGTPSTLVKTISKFKGKEQMKAIKSCSPLGIVTNDITPLLLLLTSKFEEKIIWFVAKLSIII